MSQENGVNGLKTAQNKEIKSVAFFDIESTGLPTDEKNRTKITELSIIACSAAHLNSTKNGELPRVLHKLTLCFNPGKVVSYKAEELTGLNNHLLEHENKFDKNVAETVSHFFAHLQKPCVMIAHNGINFDFPLLKRMLELNEFSLCPDLLAADSLMIFREIDELEEMLVAEASVRPLSPSLEISTEVPKKDDEEELDNYISQELEVVAPRYQAIRDALPPKSLREINETTPVKQISNSIGPLVDLPKASHSNTDDSTPHSDLLDKFNQNKKRLREFPPKSRRDLFGAKKPFKLNDIYKRCFNEPPLDSHYAEGDVMTLLKCAIAKKEDFIRVATEQATFFKDIPALGK